jgi:hypothetical protein
MDKDRPQAVLDRVCTEGKHDGPAVCPGLADLPGCCMYGLVQIGGEFLGHLCRLDAVPVGAQFVFAFGQRPYTQRPSVQLGKWHSVSSNL